ncbi:MAG TPA: DUF4124 domain-containing protein [Steroidobacteraceae bacterium]|jgi:hypothetical protein|nr:DUF4124 domain-containing protein [Steroidobacteraceae bacterium]
MPTIAHTTKFALALTCVCAWGASCWAETPAAYKWVDDQGVVHYGDSIPPQYAQKESTLLNKQGVPIGHNAATRSPAELAASADAEQQLARQKQHDSFLLATYTSVKDIEQLRDERLLQIKGQRVAAEQYVASLGERLAALQTRAQNFKPYSTRPDAHRMPDDLAEQMVHTLNDMRAQKAALSTSQEEEAKTQTQFQSDIDRYKDLRAAQAVVR